MTFPIVDWVAHHGRVRPTATALRTLDDGATRTWAELDLRVGRLARALRDDLGLRTGDRVVSLTDGDLRVMELQFACIRAGLSFAPLNFRLTVGELAAMCGMLEPALMVTDAAWGDLARACAKAAAVAKVIGWSGPDTRFMGFAQEGEPAPAREDMRPEEVALVLFTSGSTGTPKAATCTLEALVWQAFNQADVSRVADAGSHVYTPLPLFHAGGLNSLTNPVLFFGGQVTISARFAPEVAARFMGDPAEKVTHVALVPLMYDLIAQTDAFEEGDFSTLRTAILAGGRVTPGLQARWAGRGVRFSPQYGGTETGPSVTALEPSQIDKALGGSIGTTVMHVSLRLVGEDGQDAPAGESGEIWLKGPAITRGYIGRDRALDFADGWFRTGDVAYRDADGFFFLVDRLKDMFKSGGENVSSVEVEQVLAQHPDVAEAAVIGVRHEKWGEVGLAIVVPRDGAEPTIESLRRACEGRLARYKHPHACEILESLPRNVTGKVAKDELRRRFSGTLVA